MDFIEWLIKQLIQSLTEKGVTNPEKVKAAYERIGRILVAVEAAHKQLGDMLK